MVLANCKQQRHAVATVKRKGMILPFQPLSLAFHNVNYYVDMPTVCSLGRFILTLMIMYPKSNYYLLIYLIYSFICCEP